MKHFLLATSLLLAATAFGQVDKIEADRPTEAQSVQVVSKKTF